VAPYLWLREFRTDSPPDTVPPPPRLTSGIELSHVTFAYRGTERPALSDVSAFLPAGSEVEIVGEYGSGKTRLG
jgi:ATP-binding cassette subfamily B protein